MPSKKRGAPKGNRNALKHGFYSDQFRQAEKLALTNAPIADMSEEIKLLRVQIHRYLEAENNASGELDYETRLSALRAVSLATNSLTRLVRLQTLLSSQVNDYQGLIDLLNSVDPEEDDVSVPTYPS